MEFLQSIIDDKSYENMTVKELLNIIYEYFPTIDDVEFKGKFLFTVRHILLPGSDLTQDSCVLYAKERLYEIRPEFTDIYFIPTKEQILSYTDKEIQDLLESVDDDDKVYCAIESLRAQVAYRKQVVHELVKRFRK